MTNVHFMSQNMNWQTPEGFYKGLDEEFHFDFDPCPTDYCPTDPVFNGLQIEWKKRNFMNPPYGRAIVAWMKKAYEESLKGRLVVCLVPSRTDTRWWHDYAMKADEIRFIKGRLKFQGATNSATFPSALVIFSGTRELAK